MMVLCEGEKITQVTLLTVVGPVVTRTNPSGTRRVTGGITIEQLNRLQCACQAVNSSQRVR